jgi:prepilin-type N-terminal cleavage/methylation domain-containing protein
MDTPKKFKISGGRGFTLIEFIIYLAIVGVVLAVSGAIGFNVLSQRAAMTASEEVSQNARLAMEKISLAIRNAEAINTPVSGASSSVLSLRTDNPVTNPTTFSFSSGVLWLQLGDGTPTALTSSETEVVVFQAQNVSYPDTTGTIKATLQLRAYNPEQRVEYEKEQTYEFTESARRK